MKLKKDLFAKLRRNKWWLLRAMVAMVVLGPLLLVELLVNLAASITDWIKWKWVFSPIVRKVCDGLADWVGRLELTEVRDERD